MNVTKAVMIVVSFVLLFVATPASAAGTMSGAELEAFLDDVIHGQMDKVGIAGVTLSVVSDGEVILSKGYGYADLNEQTEVDPERTLFRVGSISKLFVWTAVMQLVEQGKLDLHTDVNAYLDFELPHRLLGAPHQAAAAPITLMHLMTHSAGFEDVGEDLFHLHADQTISLEQYVRTHVPARVFPPGDLAAYSNYGSALAGYIVQRVSGLPFWQYVEENIFQPLQMTNSTFRQPVNEALSADVARGYRRIGEKMVEGAFVYALEPAGGMSSAAADMARFMLAHLQGGVVDGERILTDEIARQMQSRLHSQHPLFDGMAYGFHEHTVNGHRVLMHAGSVVLFNSGFYLLPEQNIGVFVSYSGGGFSEPADLFRAFMNRYDPAAGSPTAAETSAIPLAANTAAAPASPASSTIDGTDVRRIVGEYHINRRSFTTAEALMSLFDAAHVGMDGDGNLLVAHLGETDTFVEIEPGVYRNVNPQSSSDPYGAFATLVFRTGPDGRTVLLSDGPMSYTKAPTYATTGFTLATILICVLVVVSTLTFWVSRYVVQRLERRQRPDSIVAVLARGIATAYGLLMIGFLLGLLGIAGDMEPVYGLPKSFFGIEPSWSSWLNALPTYMVVLAGAMVIFTAAIWRKRYWRIGGRVHYTLVTIAAVSLLVVFNIWNVL